MDLLFFFLLFVIVAALCYTVFRLYQLRTVANLSLAAAQVAVVAFLLISYEGGVYLEPFVIFLALLIGVSAPLVFLYLDITLLRGKIRDRFGLSLSQFLYKNDREEAQKEIEKERYIDQILKPRVDSYTVDDILGEIRVERADTSKNIQKQLEAAAKKYEEGDYSGSLTHYQTIEKLFNRSPALYFNIGNLEYDRGSFDAAAKNYRRGAECAGHKDFELDDMSEKIGVIYYNLGNAYFHQKKYGRATEAYKLSASALPSGTDTIYNLSFCHAMDFEETGDMESAVDAFKSIIEDMPENLYAWFHYGKCLLKMKKNEQAIDCFQKVVSEDLMFYEAWYRLAIAYDECGNVADAVKAYYTSIQIKPDFIDSYNNLGVLLSTDGRHGEALRVLKSALRIKPGDAELIYNIGTTLYLTEKYDEALNEFLTCERMRPDDESVLYMLSLINMNIGKPQDSLSYLEKAVRKDPEIGARACKEEVFKQYVDRDEYSGLFAR